jgi:hypothetical protein
VSVLFLKNLAFTLLVPGSVAVYIPLRLLQDLPRHRLVGASRRCRFSPSVC